MPFTLFVLQHEVNMQHIFVALSATLLLTACTTAATPEYGNDHPANPRAPASAWEQPGSALSSYKASSTAISSPVQPPEQQPAQKGADHAHEH
jgi:hypothetical protein